MDIFDKCQHVSDLLNDGKESSARDEVIKLLAQLEVDGLEYSPLVNRLVRDVGLFPYLQLSTST